MDIQNQDIIRRRGSFVHCGEAEGKMAFQGSLATSKLVSKNKEHNRGKGHKANGLTPVVLLPAIRHLVWPAPDPPTTFFDISKSKIILWSKLLQLRFEMYFFLER